MPISATGHGTSKQRGISAPPGGRGFTLLEVLVVVAIIAVFFGVATLSTDLLSFERKMEREARRLESLMRLASEMALLQSVDLGLQIYSDGYGFLTYDHATQRWQPMTADEIWDTQLLEQMQIELSVEDREVELEAHDAYRTGLTQSESESDESDGSVDEDSRDDEPIYPAPQIVIFSSGEFTPFALEILKAAEPAEPGVLLTTEFDGTIEVGRDES